jgi:hypothetical protein
MSDNFLKPSMGMKPGEAPVFPYNIYDWLIIAVYIFLIQGGGQVRRGSQLRAANTPKPAGCCRSKGLNLFNQPLLNTFE